MRARLVEQQRQVVADELEGIDEVVHCYAALPRAHGVSRRCASTSSASATSASPIVSTAAAMNSVLKVVGMASRIGTPSPWLTPTIAATVARLMTVTVA